jgi:hypothetical protein
MANVMIFQNDVSSQAYRDAKRRMTRVLRSFSLATPDPILVNGEIH